MTEEKDLNRLIAEKVMGWTVKFSKVFDALAYYDKDGILMCLVEDWKPEVNIKQAMECVGNSGLIFTIQTHEEYVCVMTYKSEWSYHVAVDEKIKNSLDEALATAIVHAIAEAIKD